MNLIEELKALGGYWHYEGGKYLATLTSGKVSDTFINTGVLTCRPDQLSRVASVLAMRFVLHQTAQPEGIGLGHGPEIVNGVWREKHKATDIYVCGSAMGGVTLTYEVARHLGATAIFTEPMYDSDLIIDDNLNKASRVVKLGQQLKRFEIPEGAIVLFVEDVITTGRSTREMIHASYESLMPRVCQDGIPPDALVHVLSYILCLVNRSGLSEIELGTPYDGEKHNERKFKIISLADVQARIWDTVLEAQNDLIELYCSPEAIQADPSMWNKMKSWIKEGAGKHQDGSVIMEAVRPKDNWSLLTGGSDA